jgi:hypothetical protein
MYLPNTGLKIFIGWDSKYPDVSEVCAYSLINRSSIPVKIFYLKLSELQTAGVYYRPSDPLASTEFTYSRFLTPYLSGHEGIAIYCDNDFLWLDDVAKLIKTAVKDYPLHCVHHFHCPPEKEKMDGQSQTQYPRKNWSSLMLFDCSHPLNRILDVDTVNKQPGSYLHQMQWLPDDMIGKLDQRWNWLEGWYPVVNTDQLGAIHYTRGGPWLAQWRHCDFAENWLQEHRSYLSADKEVASVALEQSGMK